MTAKILLCLLVLSMIAFFIIGFLGIGEEARKLAQEKKEKEIYQVMKRQFEEQQAEIKRSEIEKIKSENLYLSKRHIDIFNLRELSIGSCDYFTEDYPFYIKNGHILDNEKKKPECDDEGIITITRHLKEDDDRLKQINQLLMNSSNPKSTYEYIYPNDLCYLSIPVEVKMPNGKIVWIYIIESNLLKNPAGSKLAQLITNSSSISLMDLFSKKELEGPADLAWRTVTPKVSDRVVKGPRFDSPTIVIHDDPACFETAQIVNKGPGTVVIKPETVIAKIVFDNKETKYLHSHYPIILFPGDFLSVIYSSGIASYRGFTGDIDPDNKILETNKKNNHHIQPPINCELKKVG